MESQSFCEFRCLHAPGMWTIEPLEGSIQQEILLLHGYGQSAREMLPLAAALICLGDRFWLPDLPGHGENREPMTAQNLKSYVQFLYHQIHPHAFIGFSLGARLSIWVAPQNSRVVAISPPSMASFSSENRRELLGVLHPRRVREAKPMVELASFLTSLPEPDFEKSQCLVLYAKKDLKCVQEIAERWRSRLREAVIVIPDADHASILTHAQTADSILQFLRRLSC